MENTSDETKVARDAEAVAQMYRYASNHSVEVATAALIDMLCLEGEKNVTEKVTIEEIAVEVPGIVKTRDEREISDSYEEVPMSFAALIQSLSYARDILLQYGNLSEESSKEIYKTQRALRLKKQWRIWPRRPLRITSIKSTLFLFCTR